MKPNALSQFVPAAGCIRRFWSLLEINPVCDLTVLWPYFGDLDSILVLPEHSHFGGLCALDLRRENINISHLDSVLMKMRFDLISRHRLFQSGNRNVPIVSYIRGHSFEIVFPALDLLAGHRHNFLLTTSSTQAPLLFRGLYRRGKTFSFRLLRCLVVCQSCRWRCRRCRR